MTKMLYSLSYLKLLINESDHLICHSMKYYAKFAVEEIWYLKFKEFQLLFDLLDFYLKNRQMYHGETHRICSSR